MSDLPREIWRRIFQIKNKNHYKEIQNKMETLLKFPVFTKDDELDTYFAYVSVNGKKFHFDIIVFNDLIYKSISQVFVDAYYDIYFVQIITHHLLPSTP
jgi:hypothetical protein